MSKDKSLRFVLGCDPDQNARKMRNELLVVDWGLHELSRRTYSSTKSPEIRHPWIAKGLLEGISQDEWMHFGRSKIM